MIFGTGAIARSRARMIPPTAQNQAAIEADVRRVIEQHLRDHRATGASNDQKLQHRCEMSIRNHDPCISCATHFLNVDIERSDSSMQTRTV